MSLKKMKTPLELLNDDVQGWIDKTEDNISKFPFYAVKEMIRKRMGDQVKFAGKMYDYGASGKWGYENGKKFFEKEFSK
jgi:hypothetical protein|tara:strand:+ start:2636 stop:2872 length:237 start_codon:yes stop_codon:yes gene_type:complete